MILFLKKSAISCRLNWSIAGTGLVVADIAWSHDKYETMNTIESVSQKAIISTYNPTNPVTIEVLSEATNFVHEIVVVDVILHSAVLGGTDATIAIREKVRGLVLAVLHASATLLSGADVMAVEGEYVRGELPQIQREAFKVVVSSFEVISL